MALFPKFEDNQIFDGSLINLLSYCKKHCNSEKCQQYYSQLISKKTGYYVCPLGLCSYVHEIDATKYIYTGFRVKDFYIREKAKFFKEDLVAYNPVLSAVQAEKIINEEFHLLKSKNELANEKSLINDLLHETRKMNGQIKNICDKIWELDSVYSISDLAHTNPSVSELFDEIRHIHIYSYMTFNRFSFYDMIVNPKLEKGKFYNYIIYKKFDKLRLLLRDYDKKDVKINLNNKSTYEYRINSSFEALLFILLQNAVKYSPNRKPINIYFEESNKRLKVEIISIGPYCKPDEILKLGSKGFRGDNAISTELPGHGLGLNFAKKICEQHKIKISFRSEIIQERINSIPYGNFIIELIFEK